MQGLEGGWVYDELAFVVAVEFFRYVGQGRGVEYELTLCPGGGAGKVGVQGFAGTLRAHGDLFACSEEDGALALLLREVCDLGSWRRVSQTSFAFMLRS